MLRRALFRIDINPEDPASIQRALNTEWLLTNSLGGYAMGTVLGVNTRRYHGLLVAATKPPVGRIVALHSMIEQLVIPREDGSEEIIDLSTQQFVGGDGQPMLHPGGWKHLITCEFSHGFVQWTLAIPETVDITRLALPLPNRNQLHLHYVLHSLASKVKLLLRPFIPLRDFHSMGSDAQVANLTSSAKACSIRNDAASVTLQATTSELKAPSQWHIDMQSWNRFCYQQDRDRAQDWVENVWSPGFFEFQLQPRDTQSVDVVVDASLSLEPSGKPKRRVIQSARVPNLTVDSPIETLRASSKAFVVSRRSPQSAAASVIAGYPWFGDWGRDTMISLPGLMLCTKRYDEALSCLLMFARNIKNGLIPNVFDDYGGAAHYNTVDAPLWFIHAVHEYRKVTRQLNGEFLSACRQIIAAYRAGTDYHIFMDADGLISAGDEGSQLTWMDAKRDGVVFTPRHGKAVEINALWHNGLCCMTAMTDDPKERDDLRTLAEQTAASFREKFWWNERNCLHDVLQPNPDGKLRPNQIFGVSLPHSPLNEAQQRAVVKIIGERLLTPYGLRTLDRNDPDYRGRYEGSLFDRDRAYHNGTVWPWLIGPYCEAQLRIEKFSDAAKQRVREILQPLLGELDAPNGGCVNQLAEVYDGDEPQRPNGCPAQAWSVAEVLRILTLIS